MKPGELDRRLVGLGPLLQKKHWPPKRLLRRVPGERSSRLHVPGVRHMNQLADLFTDRLDDPRRAMPEQVAAPAGKEVEVTVPLGVPDPRTFALTRQTGKRR